MIKKRLNSILLVCLLFIWGSVFYKYFIKKDAPQVNSVVPQVVMNNFTYNQAKDSFKLALVNNDPFRLSKSFAPRKKVVVAQKKRKPKTIIPLKWPKVAYYGFVKRDNAKTKLALVKVNGKLYRKREKEYIDELQLVSATSDSIIVSLSHQKRTVKRNK